MATNEQSLYNDQFFRQLVVALKSAKANTSLEPFLIFDGEHCSRLTKLLRLDVQVIRHELSFKSQLEEYIRENADKELLPIRTGAYLRSEIPIALKRGGFKDKFVLYTDADVVFLRRFELNGFEPKYFSAVGRKIGGKTRLKIGGWRHYNSGVMLMNVDAMCDEHARFVEFVLNDGFDVQRPPDSFMQKNLFLSDQVALNLYYKGRIESLDKSLNWHPSQGRNDGACIVHFNGLKWTQWEDFLAGKLRSDRQQKFNKLVKKSPSAYNYYVQAAKNFE